MKKKLLAVAIIICQTIVVNAQLNNDTFVFRDDVNIDYNLYPQNNDVDKDSLKIISAVKIGSNASKYIITISSDSSYINVYSSDNTLDTATFYYKTIHRNTTIDSAFVYFQRKVLVADVYPGDCNRDNLVNHFDIFPIGQLYQKYGDPRNNADTNLSFTPKKVRNWFFQIGNLNAKNADIDGNGIIDNRDIAQLPRNFGNAKGNYNPILSTGSNTVQLRLSISDTVDLLSATGQVSIPILISSPAKISSYGIGYSYTVRVYNKSNFPPDSFYPHTKYIRTNIWDEKQTLFIKDTVSFQEHVNVAYCRNTFSNGDMDPQAGIVEIIVDEVLLGIAKPEDLSYVNILLKEVALIDNNYNTIPITPVSKRIYFRKAKSSINNSIPDKIKVYPTLIDNSITIERLSNQEESYTIYNSIGQQILKGNLRTKTTVLSELNWSSGIYHLKLDSTAQIVKLYKF